MRHTTAMAAILALAGPMGAAPAARAQDAKPEFSVDDSRLPPLMVLQPKTERDQQTLLAAGAGAIVGIVAADIVTGGLLLLPLGLPSFSSLVGGGGGTLAGAAAAVPAPTYTVVQQVLGGVATMVAALGGGYIGMRVAGPAGAP